MERLTAAIYLTGSELTRGETRDLNGPFLATELTLLGFDVEEVRLLPDNPEILKRSLEEGLEKVDVLLVSGGLGPTQDDHTIRALAEALGRRVMRDPRAESRMRARVLSRVGSEDKIPDNYFKQAEVVEGSQVLENPVGLAPGCLVETRRAVLIVMPGVPRELRALFRERVLPEILQRFHLSPPRIFRAKILGHGESWVESRIQKLGLDLSRVDYGISARPGEILLKFVAHQPEDRPYIDDISNLLETEFKKDMIPLPEGLLDASGSLLSTEHARIVHDQLLLTGLTVATAESCTGGLIAKLLTDYPDSSGYFLGSVVAYHNRIKESILGVDPSLLEGHGAVSEPVCRAMATSVQKIFGADYGIGVTGIAGPGGGTEDKPVGLVYIGIACQAPPGRGGGGEGEVFVERQQYWGDRTHVRNLTAVRALDLVRRDLMKRATMSPGK